MSCCYWVSRDLILTVAYFVQIEKERAALSEKEAETDAKLEEILKYCEERTKRADFDKDAKQVKRKFLLGFGSVQVFLRSRKQ